MSVVDIARKYIGSPYVFGANGENQVNQWIAQDLSKM